MANIFKDFAERIKTCWKKWRARKRSNIFRDFIERVKIDWKEWRAYKRSMYDVNRDQRLMKRALKRARVKNAEDGKTYWIFKDQWGGINEVNNDEFDQLVRLKYLKPMNFLEKMKFAKAIVTSNKSIREQYTQIQLNKEKDKTIKS